MSPAVHFTRVEVRQMPGFPRGGLALDGLVGGVNVVYGPNASGKTTLVRAMQRLLRPHSKGRHADSLAGVLAVAGKAFEVDSHLGQTACRSGGQEASLPVVAPAEVGERYVLALHDLVQQEDDRDIVQQILREAAGGYDVAAAAKELHFDRDRPSARNIGPVKEYNDAVTERRNAESRLASIDREEQGLADIIHQRSDAEKAARRQEVIERALAAIAKNRELEGARKALENFPPALAKLAGNEGQRLTELGKQIANLREKLAQENRSLQEARRSMAATGLPETGVTPELVGTLQRRCETLRGQDAEIERLKIELAGAESEQSDALVRLGPEMSIERAGALDAQALEKLFTFVRQAEDVRLEGEASQRVANWLGTAPPVVHSPETLQAGIALLQRWLGGQRVAPATSAAPALQLEWLVAAGITALLSVALALVHPSWLLLLLVAAALAAWGFLRDRLAASTAPTDDVPAQWAASGLPPLSDWNLAEVQAALRRFEQQWAAARLEQEKEVRFAEVQERRAAYEQQRVEIDKKRQAWRSQFGIDIDIDDARLYLMADAIQQAQAAQAHRAGAQAKLASARQQRDGVLDQINADLVAYVASPAADADEASAIVRALDHRRQGLNEGLGHLHRASEAIEACTEKLAALEGDRQQLFTGVGLASDDEPTLRQWIQQLPAYQQARSGLTLARHDFEEAQAALGGNTDILQQSPEQLQTELRDCQTLAQRRAELDQQIGDIQGRVRRAKEETALEAALAREAACLDELRASRDTDAAQLVGNVLVGYLARQQRDFQQPGVLRRAGELFARITHGRYELHVQPGDPPGFRALDTSLGREQGLDELSSGTRLQLLLAVRVAFVEQQEQGLQLPLIFDETLGNSDEQRAQRIIEAAVELARGGRQVFYFTAQHDELGKWRRFLRGCSDVTHREFDLAKLRGFSESEHAPEMLAHEPVSRPPVPEPDGDDWWAYGRRLNVPALDRRGHVGGMHLWYVIDDVGHLHRLLAHDINRWGQLQTLVQIGSADGLSRESPVFRRADAAARLLAHLLRYWRQGRGEPVTRDVLEKSGAISDSFIDEVSELAQSLHGDARQLIQRLRGGQVKRSRRPDRWPGTLPGGASLPRRPAGTRRSQHSRDHHAAGLCGLRKWIAQPRARRPAGHAGPRQLGDVCRARTPCAQLECRCPLTKRTGRGNQPRGSLAMPPDKPSAANSASLWLLLPLLLALAGTWEPLPQHRDGAQSPPALLLPANVRHGGTGGARDGLAGGPDAADSFVSCAFRWRSAVWGRGLSRIPRPHRQAGVPPGAVRPGHGPGAKPGPVCGTDRRGRLVRPHEARVDARRRASGARPGLGLRGQRSADGGAYQALRAATGHLPNAVSGKVAAFGVQGSGFRVRGSGFRVQEVDASRPCPRLGSPARRPAATAVACLQRLVFPGCHNARRSWSAAACLTPVFLPFCNPVLLV
jgi:energy-coupling factor transporter ATP-binding protein EcfA2